MMEIGWHDLQIRQVLGILQIVQCYLQIGWPTYQLEDGGQFANWPDWQIGPNIFTIQWPSLQHSFLCY